MERIYVKTGVTAKLAEKFNVTQQTVRVALRGASDSETAMKIREDAINNMNGFYAFYPKKESV